MSEVRRRIVRLFLRLVPFRVVLVGLVLLAASGLWLRSAPRFLSAAWGMTEMAHVAVGWVFVGVFVGYLVHHLSLHWGSLRNVQRVLGLVLVLLASLLLVTGGLLAVGRSGGFPSWVKESHYLATFGLAALVLIHGTAPLRKRLFKRGAAVPTERAVGAP